MSEPVVRVEALTKRFGDFVAVDHVSFTLSAGEILGYLGPNGSGKTTTIRMLLGLLRPSEGSATVLGFDSERQAESIRSRVGYMCQKFALYNELTSMENLIFYAGVYGMLDRKSVQRSIDLVGLSGLEDELAGDLPIGWRQRLALAAAIVHRPNLLFLDEPTSGVDPVARRAFWKLIYHLVDEGVTAFVTTHYMDEAEYCHRVGIMHHGQLLALDTPSRLKNTAFSGLAWDIHTESMRIAMQALQDIPFVTRMGIAGDHLRAITPTGIRGEQLVAELGARGLASVQALTVEPSLEDVFLALAGD